MVCPSTGWWPTTNTGYLLVGHCTKSSSCPGVASGASSARILYLRPKASAVCSQRLAGLTHIRAPSGNCLSSQAAIRAACFSPRGVSERSRSSRGCGSPSSQSSASAWRHKMRSIAVTFCVAPVTNSAPSARPERRNLVKQDLY